MKAAFGGIGCSLDKVAIAPTEVAAGDQPLRSCAPNAQQVTLAGGQMTAYGLAIVDFPDVKSGYRLGRAVRLDNPRMVQPCAIDLFKLLGSCRWPCPACAVNS